RKRAPAAGDGVRWEGIVASVQRRYDETDSENLRLQLSEYMIDRPCTSCDGKRLKPESLAVTLGGLDIGSLVSLSISGSLDFVNSLKIRAPGVPGLEPGIAGPILKEIRERLGFLV